MDLQGAGQALSISSSSSDDEIYPHQNANVQSVSPVVQTSTLNNNDNIDDSMNMINFSPSNIVQWTKEIRQLVNNDYLNDYLNKLKNKKLKNLNCIQEFIIESPAKSLIEKLWLIYMWIACNIEYSTNVKNQTNIKTILNEKKCDGYGFSFLFKNICNSIGINCVQIIGYGKGFGYKVDTPIESPNHAWNAVYVRNKWEFVDVAWASGYYSETYSTFVQEFRSYYFLTPPDLFIYQHFSNDYQKQSPKINLQQFERLPLLRYEYFLNELDLVYPDGKSTIMFTSNPFTIQLKAPLDTAVKACLYDYRNEKYDNCILIQRNYITSNYELNIRVPHINKYFFRLFVKSNNTQDFKWAGDVAINLSTKLRDRFFHYPLLCNSYFISNKRQVYLISPIKLILMTNELVEYKLHISKAISVALIDEFDNFTFLEKINDQTDIWHTKFANQVTGELKLSVQFIKNGVYHTAYSYMFI